MRRFLGSLSLFVLVTAAVAWLALGANRGWTRTSVPVKIVDQVTGIEGIEYHKGFVPGVDFVAAALIMAGFLAGASLFFNHPSTKHTQHE